MGKCMVGIRQQLIGSLLITSQNGWPASKDPHEIGVKSYAIADSGVRLRCAEKVAPLLVAFASQFHEHIEPIDDGNDD